MSVAPSSAPQSTQRLPARSTRPAPCRRFDVALRRAEVGGPPRDSPAAPRSAAGPRAARASAPRSARPDADPSAAAPPPAPPSPRLAPPPGVAELQAAIRAAPPAIAAAMTGQGPAQLALDFGAALSVDLRAGAQGLELSLRPAPSLERAARAELPRLVEALRARGLRVSRAEVQPAAARPAARAR